MITRSKGVIAHSVHHLGGHALLVQVVIQRALEFIAGIQKKRIRPVAADGLHGGQQTQRAALPSGADGLIADAPLGGQAAVG